MSAATEPEDLRAELQRAEANAARLEAENVGIESLLRRPRLASLWVLVPIGAMLIAATTGHLIGGAAAHKEGAARAAAQDRTAWLAHERSVTADCTKSYQRARAELIACARAREALPDPPPAVEPPPVVPHPPCRCQAGDPLCSCL